MHCLVDYFLPLENPEETWNAHKIHLMAQYHDIDEIETGDIVGYKKTEEDYKNEKEAADIVIAKLPKSMQTNLNKLLEEFDLQKTAEAKFVKAVDRLESVLQMYSKEGKDFLHEIKYDKHGHREYKKDYIKSFPLMHRFETVMENQYENEGIYYKQS